MPKALPERRHLVTLALLSAALLAVRLVAARRIGFGDSEALYACYALHPQPAYLDHPGAIGVLARAIGRGSAPSPAAAHVVTAVLATALPWLGVLAARAAAASWRAALAAGIALACVPEIAIGLFAMTPDLLLAFAWLATLAMAALGLRAQPKSTRAALMFLGAGLFAGVAAATKLTGLILFVVLGATYVTSHARAHARTIWPLSGLAAGGLVFAPVVVFESRTGWPMIAHRFVDTQHGAGLSLRNVGAVVFGQLGYLSPLVAVAAVIVARDLWRARHGSGARDDVATALLYYAFMLPLVVLLPLCLWSRVAEPHWMAPALLALPLHWARASSTESDDIAAKPIISRRFGIVALSTSAALVALVHAWVLVPSLVRLVPASYDARLDLANELYGWPEAVAKVKEVAIDEMSPGYFDAQVGDVTVVGSHWTVCAQLHAALGKALPVGCATDVPDDFDDWYPRARWRSAETIVFVADNRMDVDPRALFPNHVWVREKTVTVMRGGRIARVFTISVWERRAAA